MANRRSGAVSTRAACHRLAAVLSGPGPAPRAGPPKGVNLFLHALSPDGSRAVGQMYPARGPGIGDGLVIDTATGKPLATVPVPKDTGIYLAAFSPDNSALATMLRSGGLPHTRIWRLPKG